MAKVQYSSVISATPQNLYSTLLEMKKVRELLPSPLEVESVEIEEPARRGRRVRLRLLRAGVSSNWVLRLDDFKKNELIVETQEVGMFRTWQMVHQIFEHTGADGVTASALLTTTITYVVPLGLLGTLADDFFIKRDIRLMLEKLHQNLNVHAS